MANFLRRAAVAIAAAAACTAALAVPAAQAATPTASPAIKLINWSGYYAATGGKTVDGVSAYWTVPSVSCAKSSGTFPAVGGLWVGTGGLAGSWAPGSNSLLEQDGIQVKCATAKSQPVMTPFYQVAGIMPVSKPPAGKTAAVVHAGDEIYARVVAPDASPVPGEFYFYIVDYTTGGIWTATYKMPASDYQKTFKSAEVVTEWATGYHCPPLTTENGILCKASGGKRYTVHDGFVYFGSVKYTYADWQSGEDLNSVAAGKVSLWSTGDKIEIIAPSNPTTVAGDDGGNDIFSTNYVAGWMKGAY